MVTVHKLSTGVDGGSNYLTRQVASADQRRAGGALADHYTAKGNPSGVWMGMGAAQLGVGGGEVTETQMRCSVTRTGRADLMARHETAGQSSIRRSCTTSFPGSDYPNFGRSARERSGESIR